MAKIVTPHVPGAGPTSGIQDAATRQALRPIMDAHNVRNGAGDQGFVTRDELKKAVEVLKSEQATVKITPEVMDALGVPLKQNAKTYTAADLKRDLANGIESILASAGPDFRLWVDNTGAKIEIGHKDLVYAGYSAVADTTNTRLPGLAITAGGIAMGYNDIDGQWVDAVAIEAATGNASFAGTVNALYGNFAEGVTIGTTGVTLGQLAAGSYTTDQLKSDLAAGVEGVLAGLGMNYRMVLDANGAFFKHKDAVYGGTATPANGLTAVAVTASGVAMGYNHPTTGAWTNAVAISATGDVTIAGTLKAGSVIEANATVSGYGTIGGIAADANSAASNASWAVSQVSGKLSASTSYVLTGAVTVQDTGGVKAGSVTWNSTTGEVTGGSGVVLTEYGLIGAKNGVPTFTVTNAGDATFSGNVRTSGDGFFAGNNSWSINTVYVEGGYKYLDASLIGTGASSPGYQSYIRAGVFGEVGANYALYNIGVFGSAMGQSNGIGVAGSGRKYGGYFTSLGGIALAVDGQMTITSSTLVSNLNADLLDGYHASSFALTGHSHSNYPSQFSTQAGTANVSAGTCLFYTSSGLTDYQFFSNGGGSVGLRAVSDERLKQGIAPETLGLEFVKQLAPKQFRMKSAPEVQQHGFIAQDLEALISGTDSLRMQYPDGVKGMSYTALIGPLVKAIQELTAKVEALEALQNG